MGIIGYVFLALFFLIYPLTACIVFDRYKTRFNCFTALIAVALYSLVSYVTVNGFIFLRYFLDPMSLRGPELAIALFFGWLYLWICSMPVFLLHAAFRLIFHGTRRRENNCRHDPR